MIGLHYLPYPSRDKCPNAAAFVDGRWVCTLCGFSQEQAGERAGRLGDSQPSPVIRPGDEDVQSQVIADIEERRRLGIARYGTALQPFNGRDVLTDIYEELLDLLIYMRQHKIEAEHMIENAAAELKRSQPATPSSDNDRRELARKMLKAAGVIL